MAKNRQLMSIVQKRGPLAFQTLVDSLLVCSANHLAETLVSNIEYDTSSKNTLTASHTRQNICTPSEKNSVDEQSNTLISALEIDDKITCNICMENVISVALNLCGNTFCSACGDRFQRERTCCYCKQHLFNMIRIFV